MRLIEQKHWWIPLVIGLLILTGCRTYGGGSTDDAVRASLLTVLKQIEAEVVAMGLESEKLANAAEVHTELSPFSERMQKVVLSYTKWKKKQKKLVDQVTSIEDNILTDWVGTDEYRVLHRALGAIVSERELKQTQRDQILIDLAQYLDVSRRRQSDEEGRLQIRPHYYNQSWIVVDLEDMLFRMESVLPE